MPHRVGARAREVVQGRTGERLVELDIWVENQKGGKVVTGRTTAALASRG